VERLAMAVTARCPAVSLVVARGEAESEERDSDSTLQRFVVRLFRDQCTISVDSSGARLHRRGYRLETAKAPLRETLAAGLLLSSGWRGATPLADPMCGAGTIPIEAALIARRIPPGWGRGFAFERWPETRAGLVDGVRARLAEEIRPAAPAPIVGADRDAGAIAAAEANAERAGVAGDIGWRRAPISALTLPPGPGTIAVNPPYGARIGDRTRLRDLYAEFGHVVRRVAPGWSVVLIGADPALERQVALGWRPIVRTDNGGLPIRFLAARVPGP
jgi:putative N6-adenine-specific DNA methylase